MLENKSQGKDNRNRMKLMFFKFDRLVVSTATNTENVNIENRVGSNHLSRRNLEMFIFGCLNNAFVLIAVKDI